MIPRSALKIENVSHSQSKQVIPLACPVTAIYRNVSSSRLKRSAGVDEAK